MLLARGPRSDAILPPTGVICVHPCPSVAKKITVTGFRRTSDWAKSWRWKLGHGWTQMHTDKRHRSLAVAAQYDAESRRNSGRRIGFNGMWAGGS